MPDLRLFIAVELPSDAADALGDLQKKLQALDRDRVVRWTAISSIHLTLKFLGETPAEKRDSVEAAMREAAAGHSPFMMSLTGVGCFPNLRSPRIVWAGCSGEVERLMHLRDAVERTVSPLGFPTESRPFSPHLTLGRVKQDAKRQAVGALGEQIGKLKVDKLADLPVDGLSLMQSVLKPAGALYTQLAFAGLT